MLPRTKVQYEVYKTARLYGLVVLALITCVVGLTLSRPAPPKIYRISKAEGAWLNRYHGAVGSSFNSSTVKIFRDGEWLDITNWRERQIKNYGPEYFKYQCTTDSDCQAMCISRAEQNCEDF